MKKRPVALLLSMLVCVVMGLSGFLGGVSDVAWFRGDVNDEARVPAGTSQEDADRLSALAQSRHDIRDAGRRKLLPLAAANLLLSALLFVAANRALLGRPGARSLAVQSLLANGVLAIATHALTIDVRGHLIDALVAYLPRGQLRMPADMFDPQVFWLLYRAQLALTLVAYGLGYAALSTPLARAYLAAVPENDRSEQDD